MPTRKSTPPTAALVPDAPGAEPAIQAKRHRAKRQNIPSAGLEALGRVEKTPKARFEYNPPPPPPPVLRFADDPAEANRKPHLLAARHQMICIDLPHLSCQNGHVDQQHARWDMGDSQVKRDAPLSQQARSPSSATIRAAE